MTSKWIQSLARYYKTRKIPSIELSKDLVRRAIQVLDIEYSKLVDRQKYKRFTYDSKGFSITRKDESEFETDDSLKFLESDFDRDIDTFNLGIHTENKDIDVKIKTNSWNDSSFSATSRDLDDIWVNGIMTKLAETFDTGKNLHQFWHSKKAFLVYFAISICVASIWYYLTIRYAANANEQLAIANWFIWAFGLPFSIRLILQWVFPKVETKQSRQKKFKKVILSVITIVVALIVGIIGNYLYDTLK